jgi:hypothetical protein
MPSISDPSAHRDAEQRFIEHVESLLADERLRIDTTRGRRPITLFNKSTRRDDHSVDVKRLMSELNRPDRELQRRMPLGKRIEVDLNQKRWWFFRTTVGRIKAICVSPARALIANETPAPMTRGDIEKLVQQVSPAGDKSPATIVVMSTSGFTSSAHEAAQRAYGRTVILVEPNEAGGFSVHGPAETSALYELFDPEAEQQKRDRIRDAIEEMDAHLSGSGVAGDKIAAKVQLPAQMVESELRSYAKAHPGLAAKKLDGRLVLFREGSVTSAPAGGGIEMPMIDRIKSLFNRRGENEKKIAFLSERRAALGQQRDRAYEEIADLETRDADLKQQFKDAPSELSKRRVTSQLLQLRKEVERRQQLLQVVNQQINVVSTHLHNLELVQQGQTAKLPDSEEMANDAAAAEEVLAGLQESSEMAESVGGIAMSGMSAEEQALYEELQRETGAPAEPGSVREPPQGTGIAGATASPSGHRIIPPINPAPEREREKKQRTEPEAG